MKRARQLVKKNRAAWVSEDTIAMARQSKEENTLEAFITATDYMASNDARKPAPIPVLEEPDNKALMDLAKRRVAAKRELMGQVADFFLIIILLFFMVLIYEERVEALLALTFCTYWGTRLMLRIFRFAKPSFKNGIAAYFRERKQRKIELEYNRLKKNLPELSEDELGE